MKALFLFVLSIILIPAGSQTVYDFSAFCDTQKVINNPYKGWYHHFYDNGSGGYGDGQSKKLTTFPGMNFLLVRLSWRHFEPQDNVFDWHWIDDLVVKYPTLKIAIAVTCKETNEEFATPKWVKDLGVPGKNITMWGQAVWEPDYGDSVFLAKLQEFHAVMAERYKNAPWLHSIYIGSVGTWGEGHNDGDGSDSKTVVKSTVLMKHIDLYTSLYEGCQLYCNDDFINRASDRESIKKYAFDKGCSIADHSILVNWYVVHNASTFSVVNPDLFEETWKSRPTLIENQHYKMVLDAGDWTVPEGSKKGVSMFRKATYLTHASYSGYHGHADVFLKDNPKLVNEMANRLGYWYVIKNAVMPDTATQGSEQELKISWKNLGVACAYNVFALQLKLENEENTADLTISDSKNKNWMPGNSYWEPGQTNTETYPLKIPQNLPDGYYIVKARLYDTASSRIVDVALSNSLKDEDGFYRIGTIAVGNFNPVQVKTINLEKEVTIAIGQEKQLSASLEPSNATIQQISWESSDSSIVKVDNTGRIFAKSQGVATVMAISFDRNLTAICKVNVTLVSSLNNSKKLNAFILNNPVHNDFRISNSQPISKIEIYDLSGKLVFISNYKSSWNVSNLKPGMYSVVIFSNEKSFHKMVKI